MDLPEDVLVIHYPALAPDSLPNVRLQVLAAIGRLFAIQDHGPPVDELVTGEQARSALQKWLASEEARRFWQLVDGRIVSRQICEKHVLVGTRHLMDDLSVLSSASPRLGLADLDLLWQAANVFVEQHLFN